MKIPIFHGGGKEFSHVTAQVFFKKPVRPADNGIGHGYSIQLNTSNPAVELDAASNIWIPDNPRDASNMQSFQQNCLQVGQNGGNNDLLYWNRNSISNVANVNGVEFGCTVMPKETWQAIQHFGEKEWQCVHLEIDLTGMTIRLIDNVASDGSVGLKTVYEAKSLPQRWIPNSLPTKLMDVPIAPWTFWQLRIVGWGNLSHATFDESAKFGVTIQADQEFMFNLIDSERGFQDNWRCYTVGDVFNSTLLTGETSNISCSLQHNGWKGKGLYYECFV